MRGKGHVDCGAEGAGGIRVPVWDPFFLSSAESGEGKGLEGDFSAVLAHLCQTHF